jgi:nitroreductase
VGAIRDALGPDFGIAVDFHGRVHRPMAKVLAKELEPFKLMFIEEPVLSENAEALKEIANHCSTPIALGERLFSRWDFKNILHDGYVDIIQPDPSHAGGITETRKIAAMAEPMTSRWHCTARWGRSRWPPTSSSMRCATTPSSRSSRSASTTTRPTTCWITSWTLPCSPITTAMWPSRRAGPGHRDQRGVRAPPGGGGASLAKPHLAPQGRLLRRVVRVPGGDWPSRRSVREAPMPDTLLPIPQAKRADAAPALHPLIARAGARAPSTRPAARRGDVLPLLEAARWAASASNIQPWRFAWALRGEAGFDALLGCLAASNAAWAHRAGALMLGCAVQDTPDGKPNRHAAHDLGQALAQLTLQATATGIAVHQMGGFDVEQARLAMRVPAGTEPFTALALGWPGDASLLEERMRLREAAPRERLPLASTALRGGWPG